MKLKYLLFGAIIILLSFSVINLFSNDCNAQNGDYQIFIKDTSADFIKSETFGEHIFVYYDITLTLHNSGDTESDEISVILRDEDGNYTKKGNIGPGEDATFIYDDHPFVGAGEHTLYFYYYPTEIENRNQQNSGSTSIVINPDKNGDDDDESIPGFELTILISAIVTTLLIMKRKKGK